MNEMMCMAEDNGMNLLYSDTDSAHIFGGDLPVLEKLFEKKYGYPLISGDMGGFHSDFEFNKCYGVDDAGKLFLKNEYIAEKSSYACVGDCAAVCSIFLGKKSYIDKLVDEAGNIAYHIRLKGINTPGVIDAVNNQFSGDPIALFESMMRGEPVTFRLHAEGGVCFKTWKNHQISTVYLERALRF